MSAEHDRNDNAKESNLSHCDVVHHTCTRIRLGSSPDLCGDTTAKYRLKMIRIG
jgi:hypothetical protein